MSAPVTHSIQGITYKAVRSVIKDKRLHDVGSRDRWHRLVPALYLRHLLKLPHVPEMAEIEHAIAVNVHHRREQGEIQAAADVP